MSEQTQFSHGHEGKRAEIGAWELREGLRARIIELRAVLQVKIDASPDDNGVRTYSSAALAELEKADDVLTHLRHPRWKGGAHLAVAEAYLDMAQCLALRVYSSHEIKALMPSLLLLARKYLAVDDSRRSEIEKVAQQLKGNSQVDERQRATLVDVASAARIEYERETARAGSFARIVYAVAAFMTIIAFTIAALGFIYPHLVPLCFEPKIAEGVTQFTSEIVCPTGSRTLTEDPFPGRNMVAEAASIYDYAVVMIAGAMAAAVAAAVSLRGIRGTSSPYNVPLALAVLKLPTGALTALLGLLLVLGGFVPGLSDLDSPAQIIAWAIVFGYAQQIATKLVDRKGQEILNAIGEPKDPISPERTPRAH
ncbi:hypothetical protein [Streptomyces sp. AC495_CC817]|uniref:hypothetical protein n=1 Tax=Streptomyces sp. AC495_CC817 TaxID=2823900 RepID=UPI001C27CB21|nr:hypothetical protein [Streptomyces sp. AC495_CC817]